GRGESAVPDVVEVLAMLAYGACAVGLRTVRRSSWRAAMAAATGAMALMCLTTATISSLTGDVLTAALVLIGVTLATAIVIPWGVLPQLGLVGLEFAGLVAHLRFDPGLWSRSPVLILAMLAAFAASIYAASTLERQALVRKRAEMLHAGHKRLLEQVARNAG